MAEVNPYQQPREDEGDPRRSKPKNRPPLDPEAAEIHRRTLRVMLGLAVILGATVAFTMGSLVLAVVDRFEPVPGLVFTGKVVATLISVLVLAAVTLAWIAWRVVDNGYSWKRLFAFAASGWVLGLLSLGGILRSDSAAEERRAELVCPAGADRCKEAFIRCYRWMRKQPGYSELTSDASSSMLRACMER